MIYNQMILIIIAICILSIISNEIRKKKTKEKVVATCLRSFNIDLVFSAIWLILAIIMLWIFSTYYSKYYSFLVPEYLNKWDFIFNYEYFQEIEGKFLKDKENMFHELFKLYTFRSGLKNFYCGIGWIIISGMYCYNGLQRNRISTEGIWIRRYKYRWNKIEEYEWKEHIKKQRKKDCEYYKLALYRPNGKFEKYISNKDRSEEIIKIRARDKEKVDNLLKEKI